jgi:hypothetical protein
MRTPTLLTMLMVTGCSSGSFSATELWDPDVVSTTDGTYVRLTHAEKLIRVQDSGNYTVIDLDGVILICLIATLD